MLRRLILIGVLCPLILTACSRNTTNQTPPYAAGAGTSSSQHTGITSESVVRVAAPPLEISKGGAAEATIHITVQDGYHVNANPATYPYLKATEIELKPPDGMSVGFIRYPNSIKKSFPFAEQPLDIYQGETELKILLKAGTSTNKGSSNLPGKLKVQACDDQVCYPPGAIDVSIPVTVK